MEHEYWASYSWCSPISDMSSLSFLRSTNEVYQLQLLSSTGSVSKALSIIKGCQNCCQKFQTGPVGPFPVPQRIFLDLSETDALKSDCLEKVSLYSWNTVRSASAPENQWILCKYRTSTPLIHKRSTRWAAPSRQNNANERTTLIWYT